MGRTSTPDPQSIVRWVEHYIGYWGTRNHQGSISHDERKIALCAQAIALATRRQLEEEDFKRTFHAGEADIYVRRPIEQIACLLYPTAAEMSVAEYAAIGIGVANKFRLTEFGFWLREGKIPTLSVPK